MRFFLFTIASLFTLTAFGQNLPDSGFTNKAEAKNQMVNGKKEGKWVEYFNEFEFPATDTNKTYYRLTVYKKGNPYGLAMEYTMNGKLYRSIPYRDSIENGVENRYYANGVIKSKLYYHNGQITEFRAYSEKGVLESTTPYTDWHITDGTEKTLSSDGKYVFSEITFKDGKGILYKYYDPNNKLIDEFTCIDNKKSGIEKQYYDAGGIMSETPYEGGKINGTVIYFFKNGKTSSETPYKDDTINGTQESYYENGQIEEETHYKNGKMIDTLRSYYENGQLKLERIYSNGKENGITRSYFQNGKIWGEIPYSNGTNDGVQREYYESGGLMHERTFIKGNEVGVDKTYYEDGKIKIECPFVDGKINGEQKFYYESGKLQRITVYVNGVAGDDKFYDENGNEIKSK